MSRVKGKDTTPELAVRKHLHAMGYRYRLHRRDLPGSPDLVFASRRAVIFVHGCLWHRHDACRKATTPKTRTDFWTDKFERNVARDIQTQAALEASGWRVLTIWQCETAVVSDLVDRVSSFLGPPRSIAAKGSD